MQEGMDVGFMIKICWSVTGKYDLLAGVTIKRLITLSY